MGLLKNKIVKLDSSNDSECMSGEFETIATLIDRTIKTARRIMSGLRPDLLEMNGLPVLQQLIFVNLRKGIK